MRRSGLLVILLLLAGAIVNVAVAWVCVLIFRPQFQECRGFQSERILSDNESLEILELWIEDTKVKAEDIFGTTYSRFGWNVSVIDASKDDWQPDDDNHYVFTSINWLTAGWPSRSLHGSSVWDGSVRDELMNRWTLPIPEWLGPQFTYVESIPVLPIWPGFAINTIFYAAILWAVCFAPIQVRRSLRRRRGLCPECAYPVGTSSVCTECGKPVSKS